MEDTKKDLLEINILLNSLRLKNLDNKKTAIINQFESDLNHYFESFKAHIKASKETIKIFIRLSEQ